MIKRFLGTIINKTTFKVVLLIIFLSIFFLPALHYKVGNTFFGDYPTLYNVNFSQYFFKYAAYPIVGKAPEFAHYQLSRTYFIQGKLQEALSEVKMELEIHPQNKRAYYILGLTLGYLNREREAIEAFGHFIEAYPTSWAARNDRAWLQFRVGDIEEALKTIEPVSIMLNPWVQNTYGTLLLNVGRREEAEKAFLRAQEIVTNMTEESWGRAYPGNDPRIYSVGLNAMKSSIATNLLLLQTNQ